MKKEYFEHDFNVDLDKVEFMISDNGLYSYSARSADDYYIICEDDDYKCVDARTNSYEHWRHDLSELMQ